MRHEMYRQIVTKLRKKNKSFTEIGNIIALSLHAVRSLYSKHLQKREAGSYCYKTRIN